MLRIRSLASWPTASLLVAGVLGAGSLASWLSVGCWLSLLPWCPDIRGGSAWEGDFGLVYWAGWAAAHLSPNAPYQDQAMNLLLMLKHATGLGVYTFGYPPPALLLFIPLAKLPEWVAAALFQAVSVIALLVAGRYGTRLRGAWLAALAFSPSVLFSLAVGQNGALTGALLVSSLALAPTLPLLAGVLGGALVLKPHLALLLPICFMASGNRTAFLSATVTAMATTILSVLMLGRGAWLAYFHLALPHLAAVMNGLEHESLIVIMLSPFALAKSVGLATVWAWRGQAIVSIAALAVCWAAWRREDAEPAARLALTAVLGLLASPYGYTYDTCALAIALVAMVASSGAARLSVLESGVLATAWFWPVLGEYVVEGARLQLGPFVLTAVAVIAWRRTFKPI